MGKRTMQAMIDTAREILELKAWLRALVKLEFMERSAVSHQRAYAWS